MIKFKSTWIWFSQLKLTQQAPLIFWLALIVRLASMFLLTSIRGILTFGDAADYIQFAHYILDQGLWVTDVEGLRAHAGPGYPALLAINIYLFGSNNFYFALILNCIFSALAVVITFKIAREFLSLKWSVIAVTWHLFYVPHIWQVQFLGKESLVFCLFSFSVYSFIQFRSHEKLNFRRAFSWAVLYTLLIHSDERYFVYLPFFLGFILVGRVNWQSKFSKISILGFMVLVLMVPWTLRNKEVYGRPLLLTERTASLTDRLLGYKPFVNGFREKRIQPDTSEGVEVYLAAADSISSGFQLEGKKYIPKIIKSIEMGINDGQLPRPKSNIEKRVSYAKEFWRPYRRYSSFYGHGFRYMEAWNKPRSVISVIQYGLLLPLLIWAMIYTILQNNAIVIYLLSMVLIHFGIHIFLGHAITRYRYPIDAFIILIAFWGLSQLISILYSSNSKVEKQD